MTDIVPEEVVGWASQARDILATYREAEDLITIGAYKPGQNPKVDRAVQLIDPLLMFLKQRSSDPSSIEESWERLKAILATPPPAPPPRDG